MNSCQSIFANESLSVALPGYRWVEFTTHTAKRPLSATSPRQVLETLVADPAFINEYLCFSEAAHGPYLVQKIQTEDFVEQPLHQEPHPVMHAILFGTGVYEGRAPEPDTEAIAVVNSCLSEIPKDASYFFLKLDLSSDTDKLSELGWIFAEYSQHFFVSSAKDLIHVVTVGCE